MTHNTQELLQALRYELNFIEQGGFRRIAASERAISPFRDSLLCLNYRKEVPSHACRECKLYEFVPEEGRTENVPCHFIPLDDAGNTIQSLLAQENLPAVEKLLQEWLKYTISRLEREAEMATDTVTS